MKRLAFVCALIGAGGLAGCDALTGGPHLKMSGTLEMTEHAVGMPVPGRLQTLTVSDGDEVAKGQLLATLERHEQAKRDYERVTSLLAQGGATQQAAEQAALALADQQILSPVDGVILLKLREPGEIVAAGSAVVVVGDRHELWVKVFVPEGQINRVRLNHAATVHFDGITEDVPGHVSFISPKAEFTPRNVQTPEERVTQTFAIKIMLDHPDPSLRPGVAADVTLRLN